MNLDLGNIGVTAIILAVVSPLVYSARNIPQAIIKKARERLIYTVKIYQTDELFEILEAWFFKNYEQTYMDVEACLRPKDYPIDDARKEVQFKQEENVFVIKHGGKRIMVSKAREKLDKAQSLREYFFRHYTLKGWRAKKEINQLIVTIAAEYFKEKETNEVRVYANNQWGDWSCINKNRVKTFDQLILPREVKADIIGDMDEFINSIKWYTDRGIPYKRGYCFHGRPGNGKTTIAMAMAQHLKKDVYLMNLNTFENDSYLLKAFSTAPGGTLILLEDIDRAFNGRENVDSKISFSTLLNLIDGALFREGTVSVITTNHIDKLDPALVREGRTDFMREIEHPTPELAREYVEMFYGERVEEELPYKAYCMSKIQEVCLRNKKSKAACVSELLQPVFNIDKSA